MLKVHAMALGAYQTNCYIIHDDASTSCCVIDPGYTPEVVLDYLEKQQLSVDAILLTHGHFDHVGAVEALVKATGCSLWISQSDYTQQKNPMNDYLYPIHDKDFCEISFCEEDECVSAGGLTFRVLETPGHTWGSVCYVCEDAMFCGDTLFAGACGRIDLPGGNGRQMYASLLRLMQLDGETVV